MSHGTVTTEWADGIYTFRLAIGQWIELQDALDKGPLEIYYDLVTRKWRVQYIREIIRVGLIGGGTPPVQALRLVKTYVEERPILENLSLALEICNASLSIPKGTDQEGKEETEKGNKGSSTSPSSMETLQ